MKFLELSAELEKHFVAILESALKAGGLSILQSVNMLIQNVKEKQADSETSKKDE